MPTKCTISTYFVNSGLISLEVRDFHMLPSEL